MLTSRNIRSAIGRQGGSKIAFGNYRRTNCNNAIIESSPREIDKMGSGFGAPGGTRLPPRNKF